MPRYSTDLDQLAREVEMAFYRASGPGGQHRNKVETAVRMVHPPSGITVRCAETRSQAENRQIALKRLAEKLEVLNRPRKKRFRTRPTAGSREDRLSTKRRRSGFKAGRSGKAWD
ncbi:MAG: peptide chain release factor-like protein [Planctomycetota bacterium]